MRRGLPGWFGKRADRRARRRSLVFDSCRTAHDVTGRLAVSVMLACVAVGAGSAQENWIIAPEGEVPQASVRVVAGAVSPLKHADAFTAGISSRGPWVKYGNGPVSWELHLKSVGDCDLSSGDGLEPIESSTGHRSRMIGSQVEEWFKTGPSGWQHGFTIFDGGLRDANGELRLRLRCVDGFLVLPGNSEDEILFADRAGLLLIHYSGLAVFDASGSRQASRFEIHEESVDIVVAAREAAFPIVVDPWIDPMIIVAPDPVFRLGYSLAMSGDTLVVSAALDSSACAGVNCNPTSGGFLANAGSAFVFVRTSSAWQRQAYLKASNPGQSDGFGTSVAISGDTIVVGAKAEASSATGVNGNQMDDSASYAGAAYVFVRNGPTWTQQAYLKASNTSSFSHFGQSVAIDGDTIVVGAASEDSDATGVGGNEASTSAPASGAAYVFVRNGSTWTQHAYLKASNTGPGDGFGGCVAIHGDTIAVAAQWEDSAATGVNGNGNDNSAMNAGAAYVFRRVGGVWSGPDYLKPSSTASGQNFGYSIDVSGDTVVVGSFCDPSPSGLQCAGSPFVFTRTGGVWSELTRLFAPNAGPYDGLGRSVAVDGNRIVLGAPFEESASSGLDGDGLNNSLPNAGAAYLFEKSGGTWNFGHYIKSTAPQANAHFGLAVDLSNDVVGVFSEEWFPGTPRSGSVRLYEFGTPSQPICLGDGSGLPCPCANSGAGGHGCGNSNLAAGALLSSSGNALLASDTLRLHVDGVGVGAGMVIQGSSSNGQGLQFGDGLLCPAGQLLRLVVLWPQAGSAQYPAIGSLDPSLSVLGQVSAPGTRVYQYWYRDAAAFCTQSTFNLTNGLSVPWQP